MFKCGLCGNSSKPHEKATHVVMETREVVYPFRANAHRLSGKRLRDDPGGNGIETVKAVLACNSCRPIS